jgi:RHS repeat-associated protein
VASASFNANNQLTALGTTSFTYDANGNLTNDGTNTYTWDERNHLASISGAVSASFQYDAFGRRVSKTIGGTSTGFLYDGANAVQELSGGTPTANILAGGIDEYFQRVDFSGAASFLTDALGSTISLNNSAGTALASYTYDPFGGTTVTGSSSNSNQYTGRENDGTGLYYYRARYYNPKLGRFISEDPLGFKGGGTNFYAYAGNSPTNLSDPSGQIAPCVVGGAIMTIPVNLNIIITTLSGRKIEYYSGLSGAGHVLAANAAAFATGCIIGAGVGTLAPAALPTITASSSTFGAAVASSAGAIVPMAYATYEYGSQTTLAGYDIAGTVGMVGDTFTMNVWALYATDASQGLGALSDAIVAQAEEAGASSISISGNAIINEGLANPALMSRLAQMYGWTYQQVNATTLTLSRSLK